MLIFGFVKISVVHISLIFFGLRTRGKDNTIAFRQIDRVVERSCTREDGFEMAPTGSHRRRTVEHARAPRNMHCKGGKVDAQGKDLANESGVVVIDEVETLT